MVSQRFTLLVISNRRPGAVYSFSSSSLHLPLGRRGFPGSATIHRVAKRRT